MQFWITTEINSLTKAKNWNRNAIIQSATKGQQSNTDSRLSISGASSVFTLCWLCLPRCYSRSFIRHDLTSVTPNIYVFFHLKLLACFRFKCKDKDFNILQCSRKVWTAEKISGDGNTTRQVLQVSQPGVVLPLTCNSCGMYTSVCGCACVRREKKSLCWIFLHVQRECARAARHVSVMGFRESHWVTLRPHSLTHAHSHTHMQQPIIYISH